jgi:hypothetical protein
MYVAKRVFVLGVAKNTGHIAMLTSHRIKYVIIPRGLVQTIPPAVFGTVLNHRPHTRDRPGVNMVVKVPVLILMLIVVLIIQLVVG